MPQPMWYLDPSNEDAKISSTSYEVNIKLSFTNRSCWPVLLLWCDYHAERVLYCKICPGKTYTIMSFVEHPWIAVDYHSYHRMFIGVHDYNRSSFFIASYEDEENMEENEYKKVFIDMPLLRLEDLCIRYVTHQFTKDEIKKLDIPKILIDTLVQDKIKPWARCVTNQLPPVPNQEQ